MKTTSPVIKKNTDGSVTISVNAMNHKVSQTYIGYPLPTARRKFNNFLLFLSLNPSLLQP